MVITNGLCSQSQLSASLSQNHYNLDCLSYWFHFYGDAGENYKAAWITQLDMIPDNGLNAPVKIFLAGWFWRDYYKSSWMGINN